MCSTFVLATTKYVFSGLSLANIEGKTVFVPYALPDEKIEVEIVEEKKSYCKAKIRSIIRPSCDRVLPKCKHFYSCGGCNMQMAHSCAQRRLRLESAKEVLERAHINLCFPIEFVSGEDWQYRNRFQFHIHNGRPHLLGKNSHVFVPIEECPIACKEMRENLNNSNIFADIKRGRRVHVFACDGRIWHDGADERVNIDVLGRNFEFSPSAFFQSNIEMLEHLIKILQEHVGAPKKLLDFYSGVGTFSVFFADVAEEVHLVEWNALSLEMAKLNIAKVCGFSYRKKCFFHAISSEKWSAHKASRQLYDVAIVDPPRSGIDGKSIKWFCNGNVARLFYVSCDVATFARDAYFLIENGGYKLEKCYFLDFYPQTHHVEVLGIFSL